MTCRLNLDSKSIFNVKIIHRHRKCAIQEVCSVTLAGRVPWDLIMVIKTYQCVKTPLLITTFQMAS